jgi:hypothetical protein
MCDSYMLTNLGLVVITAPVIVVAPKIFKP